MAVKDFTKRVAISPKTPYRRTIVQLLASRNSKDPNWRQKGLLCRNNADLLGMLESQPRRNVQATLVMKKGYSKTKYHTMVISC